MKTKTINAVISKKINEWLNSIKDKALRERLRGHVMVTGGCITSMLLNEDVNDYDIYITKKELVLELSRYYCNVWNDNSANKKNKVGGTARAYVLDGQDVQDWKDGKKQLSTFTEGYRDMTYLDVMEWSEPEEGEENQDRGGYERPSNMILNTDADRVKIIINSDGIAEAETENDEVADEVEYDVNDFIDAVNEDTESAPEPLENREKYKPVFLSSNAITLTDKIQIVIRFYGDAEEIHSNYDFVHTTNYWTFGTGTVLNQRALEAILNKELFYTGSKYPIASIIRTRKFIKRGWQINAGQYLKMAFQISKLDLSDISVLEDQLVGVDSLYFLQFIRQLHLDVESGKVDKNDMNLDSTYVVSVIDKIFA